MWFCFYQINIIIITLCLQTTLQWINWEKFNFQLNPHISCQESEHGYGRKQRRLNWNHLALAWPCQVLSLVSRLKFTAFSALLQCPSALPAPHISIPCAHMSWEGVRWHRRAVAFLENVLRFTIIEKEVGKGLIRVQCSAREASGVAYLNKYSELPLWKEKSAGQ